MNRFRTSWSQKVDDVIRSRRYTWLGMGLAGEPLEEAMVSVTADLMHICERQGISWERNLERGRAQFEEEETESACRN
jgi:hypothetical protein